MQLSKGSVKLRSLAVSPLVLALAGLAGSASTGCFFIEDHGRSNQVVDDTVDDTPDVPDPVTEDVTLQVSIQPDQLLNAAPGEGVGVFVEYMAGGQWHIWTTCDTFSSKAVCGFDIFASSPRLLAYAADQVEGYDTLKDLGDGTVELVADTDSDIDGMRLDTDPGAPLVLEVYLDGKSAEPFVYWVSDDIVHPGAPSNPVQFNPVSP